MASDLRLLESIASANYFIDKLYLDELTQYEPCALSEINRKNRFLRFCQIEKIMYDADEDILFQGIVSCFHVSSSNWWLARFYGVAGARTIACEHNDFRFSSSKKDLVND